MIIGSGSFSISTYSVPKYRQQGMTKHSTDDGVKKYLLDLQSGKIVKEAGADVAVPRPREFAFGVEFVSSEDKKSFACLYPCQ